uniref:Uncharacterized protein n=1 Tax=Heliothis virescens TaxID=7102 RepID=A0A2A4J462_HELVI
MYRIWLSRADTPHSRPAQPAPRPQCRAGRRRGQPHYLRRPSHDGRLIGTASTQDARLSHSASMQTETDPRGGAVAFALIYFTFFLDNVLLTVLGQADDLDCHIIIPIHNHSQVKGRTALKVVSDFGLLSLTGLENAAGSAAYALGPLAGGAVAWGVGFESAMRALGVLNLLYACALYRALRRHPLSPHWGAADLDDDSDADTPLATPR